MTVRKSYKITIRIVAVTILAAALISGCAHGRKVGGPSVLGEVFPHADEIRELPAEPTEAGDVRLYIIEGRSGLLGYAVEKQVVSRSGPFTILVILDPELHVERAVVLKYTGERGGDVRSPEFTRQFEGKGPGDQIRVGDDIDAATGATLSSRAMAEGVWSAIRLVQERVGTPQRR